VFSLCDDIVKVVIGRAAGGEFGVFFFCVHAEEADGRAGEGAGVFGDGIAADAAVFVAGQEKQAAGAIYCGTVMLMRKVLNLIAILLAELSVETGHRHGVFIVCKGVGDGDQAAVGAMKDVMLGPLDVNVGFQDGILLGVSQKAANDGQDSEGYWFTEGIHGGIGVCCDNV